MTAYFRWVLVAALALACLSAAGYLLNQPNTAENLAGVVLCGSFVAFVFSRAAIKRRTERLKEPIIQAMKDRGVLLVLLAALAASAGCATRVNAGNVGIKINYAGTYRGVQDVPVVTGWVVYWPFSSTVLEYPVFVQNVVWTHSTTEGAPNNEEITFTNADQMSIAVDISLAYHLDAAKVPAFYMKFRNDDLAAFTLGFMRNVTRDQFNAHGGSYHMDQIMGDNAAFIDAVRKGVQDDLGQYGVVIDQFGIIGSPRPPPTVLESITMKVQAQQIAIQKQNELAQATADANKVVAAAEGYARSQAIRADADSNYNRKVNESLTALLIQSQTVARWNGYLPTVTGGATPLISLPISK